MSTVSFEHDLKNINDKTPEKNFDRNSNGNEKKLSFTIHALSLYKFNDNIYQMQSNISWHDDKHDDHVPSK